MSATLAPPTPSSAHAQEGRLLLDALLTEQQETAVERFARLHDGIYEGAPVAANPAYRDLLPLSEPRQGEQYAFEVNLDACSGCKACVTACHNLNGLEESEVWRNVGLLVGGSEHLPVLQHVTTACHHCIDPACLVGCPVRAYEKDPVTGIVRHLDDQCIGCQYCIFKCPYDVPVYSRSKGIVRKCDMCYDRLSGGEAPACVQACPNHAIRIRVVGRQEMIDGAESNQFLPGAPEPGYTLPTTVYKSERPLPRNLLPADYYSARTQHPHLPLVWMLVLTQMSVGAFIVEQWLSGHQLLAATSFGRTSHLVAALLLGLLGLFAAVFHLGRPQFAFRAVLGLRTSWLSREIVVFGLYALLAGAYAVLALLRPPPTDGVVPNDEWGLGILAAAAGGVGVLCSAMIYVDARRPFWSGARTTLKFLLTAAILGLPLALAINVWSQWLTSSARESALTEPIGHGLCYVVIAAVAAKVVVELSPLLHLRRKHTTPLKRVAMLIIGDLSRVTLLRLFFGAIGGVALPLVLLAEGPLAGEGGYEPLFVGGVALLMLATLFAGELLERYTFFAASVAPKMPGVQAA